MMYHQCSSLTSLKTHINDIWHMKKTPGKGRQGRRQHVTSPSSSLNSPLSSKTTRCQIHVGWQKVHQGTPGTPGTPRPPGAKYTKCKYQAIHCLFIIYLVDHRSFDKKIKGEDELKFLRTNIRIPFLLKLQRKKVVMLDLRRRSKSRKLRAERILTSLCQKPSQAQIFPQKCWLPAEEEMSERMKDKQTSILANSCLHVHSVKTVNPKWCYLNILISKLKYHTIPFQIVGCNNRLIYKNCKCWIWIKKCSFHAVLIQGK